MPLDALARIAAALGTLATGHGLVLEDGTALRLRCFEDYRHPADPDLAVIEGDRGTDGRACVRRQGPSREAGPESSWGVGGGRLQAARRG